MNPRIDVFPGALKTVGEQYFLMECLMPWLIEVLPECEPRYDQ